MTDVQEPQAAAAPSDLAQQLVEAGAHPTSVDGPALLAQIQELTNRLAAVEAERGVPADPIAAQLQALVAHLKIQANANPAHTEAYAPVVSYAEALKSDSLDSAQSSKALRLINRLASKLPQHELAYVRDIAEGLLDHTTADV